MNLHNVLHRPAFAATALATALLAACGGGDGDNSLSAEVAQGYAADASTMPVSTTSSLDSAAAELETGLANPNASAAPADVQALGVTSLSGSANCGGGGTLDWTISGNTSLAGNGKLDAGEIYTVNYHGCAAAADPGLTLDGQLQLTVTAWSASASDVTLTATALKGTNAAGSTFTINGTSQRTRTVASNTGGGNDVTVHVKRSGSNVVQLNTVMGTRTASYQLKDLDWTIVRSFNSSGQLVSRSHSGLLDLAASTPRRPNATLQITTVGMLTVSSDGLASSGHFKVVTSNNTIDCTYGGGSITLTLDRGNDGSIDRTWTLTRTVYNGEAG